MDYVGRRERVRAGLPEDVDALLVTSLVNVRYLTGFTGSNAALLVRRETDRFCTDSRYVVQAGAECPDLPPLSARVCAPALLAEAGGPVGFEAEQVSVAEYDRWRRDRGAPLVPTTGLIEALRVAKDDDEIALLAAACRISDEALADLIVEIRVGQTERAVARRLEGLLLDHGADAISFESIVAGGPHSAIPHHDPTDRPLEAGDFLKIDFGALVGGYHADETRTFVVGAEPADWQREVYDLVDRAAAAGRAALAVGADVGDVDAAAREVIRDAGHGEHFGHGLGHGVGLEIHEAPQVGYGATGRLLDRTPVTVEPGVYLPGRGGVRIEDTLVVRTDGTASLTATTRDLLVLGR